MMLGSTPDAVYYPPTIIGTRGRAWTVDLTAMRARQRMSAPDGTLASWVVEAPWAHPAWHSYALTLVHLRPLTPPVPTTFYREGATHEVWLFAMDPTAPRHAIIEGSVDMISRWWLTPSNYTGQFIAPDDAAALKLIEATVTRICEGALSPDTDHIRHWMHLFGDHMIQGDKKRAGETRIIADGIEIVIPPQPGPQDRH